uniref:Uncharacterized protein n=1 Tax=Micrurus carvalhoi TaxID=3147026 RepID=A0A2H6NHV3_9SAUR
MQSFLCIVRMVRFCLPGRSGNSRPSNDLNKMIDEQDTAGELSLSKNLHCCSMFISNSRKVRTSSDFEGKETLKIKNTLCQVEFHSASVKSQGKIQSTKCFQCAQASVGAYHVSYRKNYGRPGQMQQRTLCAAKP